MSSNFILGHNMKSICTCAVKHSGHLILMYFKLHLSLVISFYVLPSMWTGLELLDHINIKSLFRALRMMESTRYRYPVVSFLSRSDHNQWSRNDHTRPVVGIWPQPDQAVQCTFDHQTRNCEKKLQWSMPEIRSAYLNCSDWCTN